MLYKNSICFRFCLLPEKMFTNCYEFEEFKRSYEVASKLKREVERERDRETERSVRGV